MCRQPVSKKKRKKRKASMKTAITQGRKDFYFLKPYPQNAPMSMKPQDVLHFKLSGYKHAMTMNLLAGHLYFYIYSCYIGGHKLK